MLAVVSTPPIIIDVVPLQLDLNMGYAASAFTGWVIGVLTNKDLTWRGHAGGFILSVILTLWVGVAVTDITARVEIRNIDYILIGILAWAGVNFFKSILVIAKDSTQKGVKKIIDGFFDGIANRLSGKKKPRNEQRNYEDETDEYFDR